MAVLAVAADCVRSHSAVPVAVLLVAWGFFGTAAPVGWGTWLSRTLPDEAEAGGGLQVAVIQFAIMSGAAIGGTAVRRRRLVERLRVRRRASARLVAGRVRRMARSLEVSAMTTGLTIA